MTKTFIAGSHETYKRALGRHFGDTIPLVISDEPRVDNPPWTGDLASAFQAEKGYDIRDVLPAIFQGGRGDRSASASTTSTGGRERFSDAFFGQIQQWSARNGLWSIGHLGGEDLTIGSRKYGFGHVMRVLRKYDIPGVDTIWKQVYPGRKAVLPVHWDTAEGSPPICDNHHFPKYASSVAHQSGKPWSWTESFAAYGGASDPGGDEVDHRLPVRARHQPAHFRSDGAVDEGPLHGIHPPDVRAARTRCSATWTSITPTRRG